MNKILILLNFDVCVYECDISSGLINDRCEQIRSRVSRAVHVVLVTLLIGNRCQLSQKLTPFCRKGIKLKCKPY